MSEYRNAAFLVLLLVVVLGSVLLWWTARLRGRLARVTAERDMLQQAARESPSPIIITGADRTVSWVNPAFEALSGYRLDELRGRSPAAVLQGRGTDPNTIAAIRERLSHGEVAVAELLNYGRSGRAYWVRLHIIPITDRRGRVWRYVAVLIDTTERRHLLDLLHEGQAELENRIARRTRELLSARDLADSANRGRSSFLARMGDRLHTPLHALLAFNTLALERAGDDLKLRNHLLNLQRRGNELLHALNELRERARLEAGETSLQLQEVAMRELVETVVAGWRRDAPQQGARIGPVVLDAAPVVIADRARLFVVVHHLIGNALRFSPEDTRVEIALATAYDGVGQAYARLTVRDAGIGIPPAELARIFDARPRDPATDDGIGLASCRHIVSLHHGELRVRNNPDQGSSFDLLLPLVRTELHTPQVA